MLKDNLLRVRQHLRYLLRSQRAADMCMEGLGLQALDGVCFASARHLARAGMASEKTWDRWLARLRNAGWVRSWRLKRPDGTLSVNLLDFSGLWREVLTHLYAGCTACKKEFARLRNRRWLYSAITWAELRGILQTGPP